MLLVPSIRPVVMRSVSRKPIRASGEDLVSPLEQRLTQLVELGQRMICVDVEERPERLVGLVVIGGDVDTVEVLEHPPGRFELGSSGEDLSEPGSLVVGEPVCPGQLQVAGSEDLGFEGGP